MSGLDDLAHMVRIGLLYDYYAPLLTARQREAVELYYLQNLSLQEIAENWSISRQAVHDIINRTVGLLEGYEKRLGLECKSRRRRESIKLCLAAIENVTDNADLSERALAALVRAGSELGSLLNEEED